MTILFSWVISGPCFRVISQGGLKGGVGTYEIKKVRHKPCNMTKLYMKYTVDGTNPAPPETLSMGYLPYQLVQDFFHQPYVLPYLLSIITQVIHLSPAAGTKVR